MKAKTQSDTIVAEKPARLPVVAANEGETHGKSTEYGQSSHWLILFFLGVCYRIIKSGLWCRKRVKNGKYCIVHGKDC